MSVYIKIPRNYWTTDATPFPIFDKQLNYNSKEKKCHKDQEHMEAK
jgi:hypothetical protein